MAQSKNSIEEIVRLATNHLASIGKRVYTESGKNLFDSMTASSTETQTLLHDYTKEAILGVLAETQPIIEEISDAIDIAIRSPYVVVNANKLPGYIKNYAVQYVVGSFLSMAHPDYAKAYLETCAVLMKQIKSVVYQKTSKSGTVSYSDMTEVEELNKEKDEQDN